MLVRRGHLPLGLMLVSKISDQKANRKLSSSTVSCTEWESFLEIFADGSRNFFWRVEWANSPLVCVCVPECSEGNGRKARYGAERGPWEWKFFLVKIVANKNRHKYLPTWSGQSGKRFNNNFGSAIQVKFISIQVQRLLIDFVKNIHPLCRWNRFPERTRSCSTYAKKSVGTREATRGKD